MESGTTRLAKSQTFQFRLVLLQEIQKIINNFEEIKFIFELGLSRTQYTRTGTGKCIYWKYVVEAVLSKLTYSKD